MCFAFNIMHDWRAMTVTVHLAPRYQGPSLSVQCYEFYLHTILFLLLIQTRPHKPSLLPVLEEVKKEAVAPPDREVVEIEEFSLNTVNYVWIKSGLTCYSNSLCFPTVYLCCALEIFSCSEHF